MELVRVDFTLIPGEHLSGAVITASHPRHRARITDGPAGRSTRPRPSGTSP